SVVLIDRQGLAEHMPWVIAALVATAAATAWFLLSGIGVPEWPGGSSLPGFTFGVLGGLIILFEFLLWGRKKTRSWRIGRTVVWMRAHIWLGLLCVPLLVYHSGLRLGGMLSGLLMVLLLIAVASGICGLMLQQSLHMRMLADAPA